MKQKAVSIITKAWIISFGVILVSQNQIPISLYKIGTDFGGKKDIGRMDEPINLKFFMSIEKKCNNKH